MQKQRTKEVEERVFLAVDVNNLWHSCRDLFGSRTRVSFDDLLRRVGRGGFRRVPRKVQSVAYTITAPYRKTSSSGVVREESSRNVKFLKSLERFGFEVKTRVMRFEKGIDKPFHTDWDVGITVDALSKIDDYDTFVIASGDGDYVPLLKQVQKKGRRVEVYTFKNSAAQVLFEIADEVFYLGEEEVFQERTT